MTERIVKTTLQVVVANYVAGMDKAAKATALTTTEAQRLAAQGAAFTTLGTTALRMGVVVATGLALAIVRFAEFDQAMSQVQAATQASADDMGLLRDAALEAGASTVYTATEAANAIEELGKAGLTTAQIVGGGLDGALTLAAAGGLEVADAAQFAATALKQFNLEGGDLPHVADLLAAGAGKAVGDVDDLAQALNQAGLIANGAGFSIEETTGVLAAFADAGLLGSDAGTSLKTAIVALQAPTGKAAALLEKYKINVYDANGEMLGFAGIAGQLESKLGDLDDQTRNAALATIFGTDALRSANVLYTQGAAGIQKYIDQTNDSGYAAKVAADRLNNLAGDVEKLGGSFDTNLIQAGTGANDTLRSLVQTVTGLLDVVGDAPEWLTNAGLAFGVTTTAILLTGGASLSVIPKWAALKAAVKDSELSVGKFALRSAAIGGAIGLATIAIGIFAARAAEGAARIDAYGESLDKASGKTTNFTRDIAKAALSTTDLFKNESAFDAAEKLGISLDLVTDAALGNQKAIDEVTAAMKERQKILLEDQKLGGELKFNYNEQTAALSTLASAIVGNNAELTEAQRVQKQKTEADKEAISVTGTAAEGYLAAAENVQALTDDLLSLIDTINKSNDVGQDAVSSNAAYLQTLADVAEYVAKAQSGVEGFALGLDETTVAGAANADMLRGLAADSQDAAAAQLALHGNTDAYLSTVKSGRQQIIDNAIALGATADQAQILADKIYAIPTEAEIKVLVDTAQLKTASELLDRLYSQAKNLQAVPHYEGSVLVYPKADGGAIYGPGSGTSDQAGLFRLSNGEHVLTADDVDAMGGQSGVYSFRRSLYRGYAGGGAVQYAPSFASSGPLTALAGALSAHSTSMVAQSDAPIKLDQSSIEKLARAIAPYVRVQSRQGTI